MTKILLDTDIGTDVDDAVALAYLLSHPDCELLGITTVSGEAEKRASLASVMCLAAEKDVPIYPGANQPMLGEPRQSIAQQASVLPHWPHQANFPKGQAIDFLADMIRTHPGEVIFLTIGPLTNAGLLFSQYPDIAPLLKGIVIMGGNFDESSPEAGRIEWNIACDTLAAEITYKTPVRLHRSLGLNVTQRVMMSADDVRKHFNAPLLKPVLEMAEVWFAGFYPFITFHDPLAASTVLEPDLCTYQHGTVTLDNRVQTGKTILQPSKKDPPHEVAMSVDIERFFQHFFRIVGS